MMGKMWVPEAKESSGIWMWWGGGPGSTRENKGWEVPSSQLS